MTFAVPVSAVWAWAAVVRPVRRSAAVAVAADAMRRHLRRVVAGSGVSCARYSLLAVVGRGLRVGGPPVCFPAGAATRDDPRLLST